MNECDEQVIEYKYFLEDNTEELTIHRTTPYKQPRYSKRRKKW